MSKGCLKRRSVDEWRSMGVHPCACGRVFGPRQTHHDCPLATPLATPLAQAPDSPHPTPAGAPSLSRAAASKNLVCPRPRGCGKGCTTANTMLRHLVSCNVAGGCTTRLTQSDLATIGMRRCPNRSERGVCGMIVHVDTVGQWDRHQRICNHRREEGPGRVGGQPETMGREPALTLTITLTLTLTLNLRRVSSASRRSRGCS